MGGLEVETAYQRNGKRKTLEYEKQSNYTYNLFLAMTNAVDLTNFWQLKLADGPLLQCSPK